MRIGIDGRYIQDHFPGIGRYTYSLCEALAALPGDHTLALIHNSRLPNTRFDLAALLALPGVEAAETQAPPFSLTEQQALPGLARRLELDVWHAPYYIAPYRLPCPLVVTIHDAISSRYPQYLPSWKARLSYEAAMRLALLAARRVIAVSQASRDDLLRFFGARADTVSVVYEAADRRYAPQAASVVAELKARLRLPERYALYLGMNKPHKNLARLVQAWAQVAGRAEADLLLAGREDARYAQARRTAADLGLGDAVRFLGDVAEADLPALYAGALFFVFPSLYEGFGLPVLEAMACGAPVICSTAPSLLEIAGGAAVTVDALDTGALAAAMAALLSSPARRAELARLSLARAARFSWRRAAEQTLHEYSLARDSR